MNFVVTTILLIAAGVLFGSIAGLTGISGGAILVPALMLGFALTQQRAAGIAQFALLPAIFLSVSGNVCKGRLDYQLAVPLMLGFVLGMYKVEAITDRISPVWTSRLLAALLAVVAASLAWKTRHSQ